MKPNQEIVNIFSKREKLCLTMFTIEEEKKYSDSPFHSAIKVGDNKVCKCHWCEEDNTNYCWNCDKPHCDSHARGVLVFPMLNTFCLECADEFLKIAKSKSNTSN